MQIFSALLDGQISWDEGNRNAALALFRHTVMMEDGLPYMEPPFFYYSTRLSLGSLLLEMGSAAEAEQAYRKDLHEYPNNGWGLFGLATALERQRKNAEAAEVRRQFHAAWQHADVRLTSTRF